MLLIFLFIVFWKLGIEAEKFRFKYLFKKGFLRSEKEIYEDTKWSQEKYEQNTQNLEYNRVCPISNIANDPHNETKPDNKKIYDDTSE